MVRAILNKIDRLSYFIKINRFHKRKIILKSLK